MPTRISKKFLLGHQRRRCPFSYYTASSQHIDILPLYAIIKIVLPAKGQDVLENISFWRKWRAYEFNKIYEEFSSVQVFIV
jgi:hypothetical protein